MNPRAWIRYGPGERFRCPLCSKGLGDVSPGTVALIRRAGPPRVAPSIVQDCKHDSCRQPYELQVLSDALAAANAA